MSKYLKAFKNKVSSGLAKKSELRKLDDIVQEHNNTAYHLGVAQYNIRLLEQEAVNLHAKLRALNQEAKVRKDYDAANPAPAVPQVAPQVTK
jgi:hypothetical protein